MRRRAAQVTGMELVPLLAANALHGRAAKEAIHELRAALPGAGVELIEWGGEVSGQQMAGGGPRKTEPAEALAHPADLAGSGVTIAVLDSGIDALHPFLEVATAVSTCPETAGVPGLHGTHCAGVIASRSPEHPGIAPGVRLLDVKVARASGWTHPGWLAKGIDAALDLGADILSISMGLNRLPARWPGGHGWSCFQGRCMLCRAVDHAVALGALVVAAAGNEHLSVRALRARQDALPPEAELLCPGKARTALTVGAVEKKSPFRPWPPSSRGGRGSGKPDLAAPGVNIVSTVPLSGGNSPLCALDLFGAASGTSAATAAVAGALALLVERRRATGLPCSPGTLRGEILARCVLPSENAGSADDLPVPRLKPL